MLYLRSKLQTITPRLPKPQTAGARALLENCAGTSLIELALVLPVLVLILAGAVDFGRAYVLALQVASAAQAGAAYGNQSFTDTVGMIAAAKLNAPGIPTLSVSATFGCECHDGSGVVVSCTSAPVCAQNVLNYAEVTASTPYTPILPYPGIPSTLNLKSKTRVRSSQ